MSCDQIQLLSPYLDGELSLTAADRVRAHAAACPACGAELDDLRAVRRLVSAGRGFEPAGADDVMARLRLHVADLVESADVSLLRLARVFTGVAASVLLAGLWLLNQTPKTGGQAAAWEGAAITLSIDPTPTTAPDVRSPESVLNDLTGRAVALDAEAP